MVLSCFNGHLLSPRWVRSTAKKEGLVDGAAKYDGKPALLMHGCAATDVDGFIS